MIPKRLAVQTPEDCLTHRRLGTQGSQALKSQQYSQISSQFMIEAALTVSIWAGFDSRTGRANSLLIAEHHRRDGAQLQHTVPLLAGPLA